MAGEPYYSPSEIYFSREQCIFIIGFVFPLDKGCWPLESDDSDPTRTFRASYEIVCCITGELWKRLETTGEAGEALIDEVQGYYRDIGKLPPYEFLSGPAKRVLCYVSGKWRRRQTYSQWKADRDYKRKHKGRLNQPEIIRDGMAKAEWYQQFIKLE